MSSTPTQTQQRPAARKPSAKAVRYVDQKLEKTRRQVKTTDIISGVLTIFAGVLGFLLLAAIWDAWVSPLSHIARWICFVGLLAGVIGYGAVTILPLLIRKINPDYAARMIEDSKPGFKNSLLNFVSLRKKKSVVSTAILDAVSRQAATDLSSVPSDATVDRSKLIRLGFILVGLVAFVVGYKMLSPKDPLQTFGRILAPAARIAQPAVVRISNIEPGDAQVFFGDFLDVSAVVRGNHQPQDVKIEYSTTDGQLVNQILPMQPAETPGRYQAKLGIDQSGIQQSLSYRVIALDGASPDYNVDVRPNPTIAVESVQLDPPAYTALPSQTIQGTGDIDAIEGTRVTIQAAANLPIKMAYIEQLNQISDANQTKTGQPTEPRYRSVRSIEMEYEDRTATAQFIAELNASRERPLATHYRIKFISTDDHRNQKPNIYPIKITPDLAPEVTITHPLDRDAYLPQNQSLTIEVQANDLDFQISGVRLKVDHQALKLVDSNLELQSSNGNGRVTARYVLNPQELRLRPGDKAIFYATATDNRTSPYSGQPDPNIARTENFTLNITPPKQDRNPDDTAQQPDPNNPQQNDSDSQDDQDSDSNSGAGDSENASGDSNSSDSQSSESGTSDSSESTSGESETSESNDSQQDSESGSSQSQSDSGNSDQINPSDATNDSGDSGMQDSANNSQPEGSQNNSASQDPNSDAQSADQNPNQQPQGNDPANSTQDPSNSGSGSQSQPTDSDQPPENGGQSSAGSNNSGENQGAPQSGNNSGADPNQARPGEGPLQNSPNEQQPGAESGPANEQYNPNVEDGERQPLGENASEGQRFQRMKELLDEQQSGTSNQTNDSQQPRQPENNDAQNQSDSPSDAQQSENRNPQNQNDSSSDSNNSSQQNDGNQSGSPKDNGSGSETQSEQNDGPPSNPQSNSDSQSSAKPSENESSDAEGSASSQPSDDSQNEQSSQNASDSGSGQPTDQQSEQQSPSSTENPSEQPSSDGTSDAQSQPSESSDDASESQSNSGGGPSQSPSQSSNPQSASGGSGQSGELSSEQLQKEEANLEHAKKATDLILEKLDQQKYNPDPKLLEEMNWDQNDLNEFLDRWQEMKQAAESGDFRAKQRYEKSLKSLGLKPDSDRRTARQNRDDTSGLNQDSAIIEPPPEIAPDFNATLRDLNRAQ